MVLGVNSFPDALYPNVHIIVIYERNNSRILVHHPVNTPLWGSANVKENELVFFGSEKNLVEFGKNDWTEAVDGEFAFGDRFFDQQAPISNRRKIMGGTDEAVRHNNTN